MTSTGVKEKKVACVFVNSLISSSSNGYWSI